ncbi:response regulator [Flavobacterium sp. KACC 22758]|jgi:CheY-like chemotaxis protein|uniref:response regulator n=1 Tax=Flavobacterium sp. KACC 22758 TaxID=3025667 RepID=UPI002365A3EF|nr:response regulator [Flavobacterium sp. KACC 22758]WDF61819.1 response regulator [Flavobacterium sp. KACC 22758]
MQQGIMTQKTYKHILLADDDPDDCDFFSEVFNENFPEVKLSISNDGAALINLLEGPPNPEADLIFLDLNMPILSGAECLEKIRSSLELKNHIVIIFSTSSSPSDIEKMYAMGANYFITKPVDYQHLVKLISKAMSLAAETHTKQPSFENFNITI